MVLSDFVSGSLLFCKLPKNYDGDAVNQHNEIL
jgi:hypothetical protein